MVREYIVYHCTFLSLLLLLLVFLGLETNAFLASSDNFFLS